MLDLKALAAINAGDINTSAEVEVEPLNPDEPKIEWRFLHHQILDNAFSIIEKVNNDKNVPKVMILASTIKALVEDLCIDGYDKKRFSDRNLSLVVLAEDNWAKLSKVTAKQMFFVIPPTKVWLDLSLKLIDELRDPRQERESHLIFIPQGSFLTKYFMKQSGSIHQFKSIWDLNLDLVPLSPDLASLEYKDSLKEVFYSKEYTCHNMAAESLYRMQAVFGKPATVLLKGHNAKITFDLLSILEKDNSKTIGSLMNAQDSSIDALIILDRESDPLTMFLTQFTYLGMIHDNFGFDWSTLSLDSKWVSSDTKGRRKVFNLYSDKTLDMFKDVSLNSISRRLLKEVAEIRNAFNATMEDQTIDGIQKALLNKPRSDKVNEIQHHIELSFQLASNLKFKSAIEEIELENDILEEQDLDDTHKLLITWAMNPDELKKVYRFLCLISLVYNGLEEKFYDQIKKEIIESHGLTHIKVFNHLERAKFLFKKNKKNKKDKSLYQKLCEPFGLRREFPDNTDPTLINLPYNNYVPLSYKLFEKAIFEAWIKDTELLNSIPGPMEKYGNLENVLSDPSKKKTMLLYMIGGMTYSEASYFRKLAESANIELKLLSTNMNKSFEVLDPFLLPEHPLF